MLQKLHPLILIAVTLCSGCGLPSTAEQGSGNIVSESREVGQFDGITFQGSGDVKVEVGQPTSVTVEIDDNLLDLIRTEIHDGRLVISNERSYRSRHGLHVAVTVPSLLYLDLSGAGDVSIVNLDSDNFEVQLNGSGDLLGKGHAEKLSVEINGSGNVDFSEILATSAAVNIMGSGDVRVHAKERLSASIYGSGNIRYRGEPKVDHTVLGSGDIERIVE